MMQDIFSFNFWLSHAVVVIMAAFMPEHTYDQK